MLLTANRFNLDDGTASFTCKSPHSGRINTMTLPVTKAQYEAWQSGTLIQDAMPHLTADEREFIITGLTAQDWEDMMLG